MKLLTDDVLFRLGITPNYVGYKYLLSALEMALEDEDRLSCVSKEIWGPLEEEYHYKKKGIESGIRTLSNRAWLKNPELVKELSPGKDPGPLSAVDFLTALYHYEVRSGEGEKE